MNEWMIGKYNALNRDLVLELHIGTRARIRARSRARARARARLSS